MPDPSDPESGPQTSSQGPPLRILVVDDHALFRDSLKSLLASRGHKVVGEATNGREAVALAPKLRPDLILMDLTMPEMDGLTATRRLSADHPELKIVVLTASEDDQSLFDAIKSGAQGYLLKNLQAQQFFHLLEAAARGEAALTPALARKLMTEFSRPSRGDEKDALTERELQVLQLLVDGTTSNRKLAHRLEVSENTIKFHVRNILDKLHLNNRAQVVGFALKHRLVESKERPT